MGYENNSSAWKYHLSPFTSPGGGYRRVNIWNKVENLGFRIYSLRDTPWDNVDDITPWWMI